MYNSELEYTLKVVYELAKSQDSEITLEHLLVALLENTSVIQILRHFTINIAILKHQLIQYLEDNNTRQKSKNEHLAFKRVLERATLQSQSLGKKNIDGSEIFMALLSEEKGEAIRLLKAHNITRSEFNKYLLKDYSSAAVVKAATNFNLFNTHAKMDEDQEELLILDKYTQNINAAFVNNPNAGDPLIGRTEELDRMIQILCRKNKNNPLLVADPGVGKTAMAKGLAQRIVMQQVPARLRLSTVYILDLASLVSGTKYRGDLEKRLKRLLQEIKMIDQAILFIDEIHTIIGAGASAGSSMDIANLLKPLLTNHELTCIGTTTYQEYRRIFEKDAALARRFQKLELLEPTCDQALTILKGIKDNFEQFHHVRYTDTALLSAVTLASRYLIDRRLPDKAIDVIDEAGAKYALNKEKEWIDSQDIEAIVATMAKIPQATVLADEKLRIQNIKTKLQEKIYGQDEAIETLSSVVKLSRSGLRDLQKPIGAFLFSGPTGVGKTELAKQLANILGVTLLRFDMSEYLESHSISRLVGAPPGYIGYEEGGLLTEAITKNPYAVILLDEIEKAHPDIFNLLLQVMDYGVLTDTNGRKADFRHSILIMTTNAGTDFFTNLPIGFLKENKQLNKEEQIKALFKPEFRNRLDSIIYFQHLTPVTLIAIVNKLVDSLKKVLVAQSISLDITEPAKMWLAEKGYEPELGARPMGRLIQEVIKKPLAEEILFGCLQHGGRVLIEKGEENLQLTFQPVLESIIV